MMKILILLICLEHNIIQCAKAEDSKKVEDKKLMELLNDNEYSPHIRPDGEGEDMSTEVTVTMFVRALGPVTDLSMDYDLDITLRQQWRDPRLEFHTIYGNEELTLKAVDKIWKPDTFFRNDKVTTAFTVPAPASYARISGDGTVLYSVRVKSKLYCPLDLSMFPFDKQTCIMDLASCKTLLFCILKSKELIPDGYKKDDIRYTWRTDDPISMGKTSSFLPNFSIDSFNQTNVDVDTNTGDDHIII